MAENAPTQVPMLVPVEDLCCPVCLKEFQEPKALPECQHNVCKTCLQEMCGPSKRIECPVCRTTSTLPQDGVNGLPTNHLLQSLIEKIPGRKEKKALEKALQDFKERIKISSTKLAEMKKLLEAEEKEMIEWDPQKVKDEIADHAQSLIDTILTHSEKLCHQVDDIVAKKLCTIARIQRSEGYLSKRISDSNETKDEVENTLSQSDERVMVQQKEEMINHDHCMRIFHPVPKYNASPKAVKFVSRPPVYCTGEKILGDLVHLKKPSEDTHIVSPFQAQHPKPIAATQKLLK